MLVTHERLAQLLTYDPMTGEFRWLVSRGKRASAGSVAGCSRKPDGYRMICLDGRHYKAARLAWFYMIGEWPAGQIDHANRDAKDDRFCNLRDSSPSQNTANRICKIGKAGYRGTYHHQGKWRARIMVNWKKIDLGMHDDPRDAALAYDAAARKFFGEFAVLNFGEP